MGCARPLTHGESVHAVNGQAKPVHEAGRPDGSDWNACQAGMQGKSLAALRPIFALSCASVCLADRVFLEIFAAVGIFYDENAVTVDAI
jgi:hypothetical protein